MKPRAFIITYKGSYLGGVAIVIAATPERALELLAADPKAAPYFPQVEAPEVNEVSLTHEGVIYNDDGDY